MIGNQHQKLIEEINSKVSGPNCLLSIIFVNDASTEQQSIYLPNVENLQSIKIINMKEIKAMPDVLPQD